MTKSIRLCPVAFAELAAMVRTCLRESDVSTARKYAEHDGDHDLEIRKNGTMAAHVL